MAVVLLGIYAWYVKGHFEADPDVDAEDLAPLRFRRLDRRGHARDPHDAAPADRVNLQVLVALGLIVVGAVLLRRRGRAASPPHFGIDAILLALVIAPIATELPEKFNSVIWVRQGKDTLAMGNITGAMVFQSTIPTVVALVFASDSWVVGPGSCIAFASAGIAFLSSAVIFMPIGAARRLAGAALLVGGVFYLAYLGVVILAVSGVTDVRLSRDHSGGPGAAPGRRRNPRWYTPRPPRGSRGRPPHPTRSRPDAHPAAVRHARAAARPPAPLDDLICYFEGDFVPMRDAKVSIMTHAFMYGTATFEGIRAYWNADQGQLYGLKIREHVERIRNSRRILLMEDVPSVDELVGARRRDGPPQRLPRGRLHPAVVLQVDPGDRRPAPRPRARAVHHRRCRSATTSTPTTASGS